MILHSQWLLTEMQIPAAGDTLVTHGALAIPETLFYSEILLGATGLISCFPSGIRDKGRWGTWRNPHKGTQCLSNVERVADRENPSRPPFFSGSKYGYQFQKYVNQGCVYRAEELNNI